MPEFVNILSQELLLFSGELYFVREEEIHSMHITHMHAAKEGETCILSYSTLNIILIIADAIMKK